MGKVFDGFRCGFLRFANGIDVLYAVKFRYLLKVLTEIEWDLTRFGVGLQSTFVKDLMLFLK